MPISLHDKYLVAYRGIYRYDSQEVDRHYMKVVRGCSRLRDYVYPFWLQVTCGSFQKLGNPNADPRI